MRYGQVELSVLITVDAFAGELESRMNIPPSTSATNPERFICASVSSYDRGASCGHDLFRSLLSGGKRRARTCALKHHHKRSSIIAGRSVCSCSTIDCRMRE